MGATSGTWVELEEEEEEEDGEEVVLSVTRAGGCCSAGDGGCGSFCGRCSCCCEVGVTRVEVLTTVAAVVWEAAGGCEGPGRCCEEGRTAEVLHAPEAAGLCGGVAKMSSAPATECARDEDACWSGFAAACECASATLATGGEMTGAWWWWWCCCCCWRRTGAEAASVSKMPPDCSATASWRCWEEFCWARRRR
jgi:hypothetical protein